METCIDAPLGSDSKNQKLTCHVIVDILRLLNGQILNTKMKALHIPSVQCFYGPKPFKAKQLGEKVSNGPNNLRFPADSPGTGKDKVTGEKITENLNTEKLENKLTSRPVDPCPAEQPSVDLSSVQLSPVDLSPVHPFPADLSPAEQTSADLSPVDLSPVHLFPADLSPVDLSPVHPFPADLSPAEQTCPLYTCPLYTYFLQTCPLQHRPLQTSGLLVGISTYVQQGAAVPERLCVFLALEIQYPVLPLGCVAPRGGIITARSYCQS
ncbi:hypothetical protein P4O66_007000 [Electrophorus voltai]|uniref:Uncharacterized protein n=1 Tax=Electrophorus voltai TaxID=2609070 RepID=A0AAD8ZHT8_9TELE|nr:hypothetical protein P4O66_007000 [Electrophorus voltai]